MRRHLSAAVAAVVLVFASLTAAAPPGERCTPWPQCKRSPTPSPTPSPSPTCTGVQVAPGDDLAAVAAAQPPATTFCLGAGRFVLTASVVAQQGDSFVGSGRASTFVEGDGSTQHLFTSSSGQDFAVRSLDVSGAVGDAACAPNCGRAFRATGVVTLVDIRCHHNMNQCAGGGGGGVRMLDSECDHNGVPPFTEPPRSAACIKKASNGVDVIHVEGNRIHHNGWSGVWCDFCSPDTVFVVVDNPCLCDNASRAVSWEVSGGYSSADHAIVARNVIQRNGWGDTRTIAAGITCNSCADLTVDANIFGWNSTPDGGLAVALIDARRGPWGPITGVLITRTNVMNGDAIRGCDLDGVTCE